MQFFNLLILIGIVYLVYSIYFQNDNEVSSNQETTVDDIDINTKTRTDDFSANAQNLEKQGKNLIEKIKYKFQSILNSENTSIFIKLLVVIFLSIPTLVGFITFYIFIWFLKVVLWLFKVIIRGFFY